MFSLPFGWSFAMFSLLSLKFDCTKPFDLFRSGRLRGDGGDLRFGSDREGNVVYSHRIVEGLNTSKTIVVVKTPDIPAQSSLDIWMIINNPTATYTLPTDITAYEGLPIIIFSH